VGERKASFEVFLYLETYGGGEKMKKKNWLLATFVIVTMLALPMSMVSATKPILVDGTRIGLGSSPVKPPRRAGNSDNLILYLAANHEWTGDIEGFSTTDVKRIMYNYFSPEPIWVNIHAVCTIPEATVMGHTGSLTIRLNFRTIEENADGTWVIIDGTNELANLHGQGKIFGTVPEFLYSGWVHFDP
jgi:hypothetical protein